MKFKIRSTCIRSFGMQCSVRCPRKFPHTIGLQVRGNAWDRINRIETRNSLNYESMCAKWKKKFLKCDPKERRFKRIQKELYKESKNSLDKRIWFYERKHKLGLALNIHSVRDNDPKQLWDQMKKLSPQRNSKFPTECFNDTGEVTCTSKSDTLKHTWERGFSLSYNPAFNHAFDADF